VLDFASCFGGNGYRDQHGLKSTLERIKFNELYKISRLRSFIAIKKYRYSN
jgi:hypothetical protein